MPERHQSGVERNTGVILGIHRDKLQPEVREYADNLAQQVIDILKKNNVTSPDDFFELIESSKASNEDVTQMETLLSRLDVVAKTDSNYVEKERRDLALALIDDAADLRAEIKHNPVIEVELFGDIALERLNINEDVTADIESLRAEMTWISDPRDRINSVSNLMELLIRTGDPAGAQTLVDLETEEIADEKEHDIEWSNMQGRLALVYARLGKEEECFRALSSLKTFFEEVTWTRAVFDQFADDGNHVAARKIAAQAHTVLEEKSMMLATIASWGESDADNKLTEAAKGLDGSREKSPGVYAAMAFVAATAAKLGRFELAKRLERVNNVDEYRARASAAIAMEEAAHGKSNTATVNALVSHVSSIPMEARRILDFPSVLQHLAAALAYGGRFAEARDTVRSMASHRLADETLARVTLIQMDLGEAEQAIASLPKENPWKADIVLTQVVAEQAKKGQDYSRAMRAANELEIFRDNPRVYAHDRFARLVFAKNFLGASRSLEGQSDPSTIAMQLARLARAETITYLQRSERFATAAQIARQIEDEDDREVALAEIAHQEVFTAQDVLRRDAPPGGHLIWIFE